MLRAVVEVAAFADPLALRPKRAVLNQPQSARRSSMKP